MSDYWKSLPRKFCDTCKCWFADNKASIEFHEKGKKHKENVQKRINDIQKKGLKDFKKQKKLENEMDKIEKAALKAFQKDLAQDPKLAEQYKTNIPTEIVQDNVISNPNITFEKRRTFPSKVSQSALAASTKDKVCASSKDKVWYEGISEDGNKYYWNSITSESQWDPPEEGFLSIEEQANYSEDSSSKKKKKATTKDKDSHADDSPPPAAIGPMPKADPYGQWTTVENEVPEEIDLQLPQRSEDIVEVYIPIPKEETFKIKEKTIGYLSGESGQSTFKKRKNISAAKRNVRQRFDES